ncbi:MAG: glutathione peroxidase [Acidobacteriales bacterium]|nr:MAG: glutathione peroxidase [Terriglobales bacterium]
MRSMFLLSAMAYLGTGLSAAASIHDFTVTSIQGKLAPLSEYQGKVVLVVNVASKCGFTPQYKGLEALYRKYQDQGFVVLGFPANNFKSQEPGTNEEIQAFCTRTYDVTFPMFSKISVVGEDKAPLYQYLTQTGGEIPWNFTKFLADRDGKVIARFGSKTTPDSPEVISAIEKALAH